MGALIDKAFDTLIFFILEAIATLLWLVNLIELGFIQVTHYFHKWVLDALPDIFAAFLTAVEELIVVFVVLAAIGLLILRIVKYIFPATAEGMPFFHFATRWFLISFLMGAPIVIIQQVDQWRVSFGQDIRNATTAAMGAPLLPALPGSVFTIYDIDGCPVWTLATPPCIEIGDVSASFVGVETLADLDTALPPAFSAAFFPYGDTTTFGNLSDSERGDAIKLARDGMFRMGLGILPNFLGGLDALLWVFLTFAFLFVYLALPITLPLAFFRRTEQFAVNTVMRGGELFIETGITAAFLGIITYALIAAANSSDLAFVGLSFFALFPVGWRFLSAVKTTNHSIGGMSVGSGAAAAATANTARAGAAMATAGVSEVTRGGLAAVGAVDQKISGALQAGGKAARVAGGAGLIAYAGRTANRNATDGSAENGSSSLSAAAGGALLGASQRATTGLTLGYLAAQGREDVAAGTQTALRSAVIGTQIMRNPALAVLLSERQRRSTNGNQPNGNGGSGNGNGNGGAPNRNSNSAGSANGGPTDGRPTRSNGDPSNAGTRAGNGNGSGSGPGSSRPPRANGRSNRRSRTGSHANTADMSAESAVEHTESAPVPPADPTNGQAAASEQGQADGNHTMEQALRFDVQGNGAVTRQAHSLAAEIVLPGTPGDVLDRVPERQQTRATRARSRMRPVRDGMPATERDQFVAATTDVTEAVHADATALHESGLGAAEIADRYRSERGIQAIADRLPAGNPYRAHPAAIRAVADAVLQPTRRVGAGETVAALYDTASAPDPDEALADRLGVAELGELGGKARMLREQIQDGAIAQPVLQSARQTAASGDFAGAAEQLVEHSAVDRQTAQRIAVVLANLPEPEVPAYLDDAPVTISTGPAPFVGQFADGAAAAFEATGTVPPLPAQMPPARRQAARAIRHVVRQSDSVAAVPQATREVVAAVQHETRSLQDAGYGARQIVERYRTDDGIAAVTNRLAAENPYRSAPDAVRGLAAATLRPQTIAPPETLLNAVYDTMDAPDPNAAMATNLTAASFNLTPEQAAQQTGALRQTVTTHAIPRQTLVRAAAYASEGDIDRASAVIAADSQADSTAAREVGVLLSDLPPLYRDVAIGPELPPLAASPAAAEPAVPLMPRSARPADAEEGEG